MCSKEEVQSIVDKSEKRVVDLLHSEIGKLRQEVREDREFSHRELAGTISNLGAEFLTAVKELKAWKKEVESNLKQQTQSMNTDISNLKLWRSAHEVDTDYIKTKVDAILSVGKWILTVVVGAVIVAVLNLVIV